MKHLLFIFAVFASTKAIAQQEPQFTQFMFFNLGFNAGYAGTSDSLLNTTAVYRDQWVGFPGNPKTFLFCADAPLKAMHGGVGLKFMDDRLGNFHFTRVGISYSFHKHIGKNGLLGVGEEVEYIRSDVTNDWLEPDGTHIAGPNTITSNFNMGLGAFYRDNKWNIGMSVTQFFPIQYYSFQSFSYQAVRHYFITAGYNFYLGARVKIVPSILIKSDDAVTTTFDINTIVYWDNFIWTGVSYRLQDAIAGMVGFTFKTRKSNLIKVGYSYDYGTSALAAFHHNTHEVFLSTSLKLRKRPE